MVKKQMTKTTAVKKLKEWGFLEQSRELAHRKLDRPQNAKGIMTVYHLVLYTIAWELTQTFNADVYDAIRKRELQEIGVGE